MYFLGKKTSPVSLMEFPFTFFAHLRLAWISAIFLRLHIRRIRKAQDAKGRINVLILKKEGFTEDILSSIGAKPYFNIYVGNRRAFKVLAAGILHRAIDDNNYYINSAAAQASKSAYRNFLKRTWTKLSYLKKFDVVLSGNFGYYAERELAAALEGLGVPFITLHKENVKSPGRVDFFIHHYRNRRGPFLGRKILVYNDIERQVQLSSGVISDDRVIVTGMPRLDRAHHWRQANKSAENSNHEPQVLFFSFRQRTGLPMISRKPRAGIAGNKEKIGRGIDELHWNEFFRQCHQAILILARENPEIKVVIKAKGAVRELTALNKMLGSQQSLPPNLKIVVGGDPFELLTQSHVVCGFNTTGIIEALALGKPVVEPLFAEALDEKMQPYIIDLEDAVEYAKAPDQLISLLRSHALERTSTPGDLSPSVNRMLKKWVGNTDGLAGERVCDALVNEVSTVKSAI
jgi:hypothetical protein